MRTTWSVDIGREKYSGGVTSVPRSTANSHTTRRTANFTARSTSVKSASASHRISVRWNITFCVTAIETSTMMTMHALSASEASNCDSHSKTTCSSSFCPLSMFVFHHRLPGLSSVFVHQSPLCLFTLCFSSFLCAPAPSCAPVLCRYTVSTCRRCGSRPCASSSAACARLASSDRPRPSLTCERCTDSRQHSARLMSSNWRPPPRS